MIVSQPANQVPHFFDRYISKRSLLKDQIGFYILAIRTIAPAYLDPYTLTIYMIAKALQRSNILSGRKKVIELRSCNIPANRMMVAGLRRSRTPAV